MKSLFQIYQALPSNGGVTDNAHQAIKHAIHIGILPPGTLLAENAIAAELDISRLTVRSAFLHLVEEGYLNKTAGGYYVFQPTVEYVIHLLELLAIMECAAIDEINLSADLAIKILEAGIIQDTAVSPARRERQFHQLLILLSKNRLLSSRATEFWNKLEWGCACLNLTNTSDDLFAEHEKLYLCIRSGDRAQIKSAILEHYSHHISALSWKDKDSYEF